MREKLIDYLTVGLASVFIYSSCTEEKVKEKPMEEPEIEYTIEHQYVEPVDDYLLAEAFIHVESRDDSFAINKSSGAKGCLQLMPIMIREANRITGFEKYRLSDRTSREKSVEIFHVVMQHHNPTYDIEKACKVWNPNGKPSYYIAVRDRYYELLNE